MKKGLHPRNRHTGHYDFKQLIEAYPELISFVSPSPRGEPTIDFANPAAVKTLNSALLKHFYGISKWDIPPGYLCPPIPGRSDYLHNIADLLGSCNAGVIPRGNSIRVLDIGVGANCIYPIIGHCEYDWRFVGSDSDPLALASAKQIVLENKNLTGAIELRLQSSSTNILKGLILNKELFDVSICNPPFHASLAEAHLSSQRKWNNLGKERTENKKSNHAPKLNFGGQTTELCYPGGEAAFVSRMIDESAGFAQNIFWFTTLISKEANLPRVYAALEKAGAAECETVEMSQGQKKSRVVAWTFLNSTQQKEWRAKRFEI